jgi:hypothetical protein
MFGQSLNFGAFSGGDEMQFLAIAGGGGGGGTGRINGYQTGGGGGGGGGYINSVDGEASGANSATAARVVFNTGNTYTITIGGGGSRGVNYSGGWNPNASYGATRGNNGGNSLISGPDINTITAIGGGGGGQGLAGFVDADGEGGDGGSGGGEGFDVYATFTPGSGTASQGTDGASNSGSGGNGGGAASNLTGLYSSITGSSIARGGGGYGGKAFGTNSNCAWGTPVGGGGQPGVSYNLCTARHATAGVSNTGGGGGGSSDYGYTVGSTNYNTHGLRNSAVGGSGVVILKIPTSKYSGTTTGNPSVSTVGSDTILQFNGSGTYTH